MQDFIYLNETGVIELAKQSWLDSKKFQKLLYEKANGLVLEGGKCVKKTLVVPLLIGEPGQRSLRVKTINETELNYLRGSTRFEVVKHSKFEFYFGFEPLNLDHPQAYGTLMSNWNEDQKVTKFTCPILLLKCAWVF